VKAKGDFCKKITLEHDSSPHIIRALKGRTDFVEGPNPAVSNARATPPENMHRHPAS
jgi:hypothetical protein